MFSQTLSLRPHCLQIPHLPVKMGHKKKFHHSTTPHKPLRPSYRRSTSTGNPRHLQWFQILLYISLQINPCCLMFHNGIHRTFRSQKNCHKIRYLCDHPHHKYVSPVSDNRKLSFHPDFRPLLPSFGNLHCKNQAVTLPPSSAVPHKSYFCLLPGFRCGLQVPAWTFLHLPSADLT